MNTSKFVFKNLTHQFTLQKTLKFELVPIGQTLANIQTKGLIEADEQKASRYQLVKGWIDDYHREFIDTALKHFTLPEDVLNEYDSLFKIKGRDDKQAQSFEKLKEGLRKEVSQAFSKNPINEINERFKRLFDKDLITKDLPIFLRKRGLYQEADLVEEEFGKFTVYFKGFHENRKNMYVPEEKGTAIAYRLIDENLPRFCQNLSQVRAQKELFENQFFIQLQDSFNEYLEGIQVQELFNIKGFNLCLSASGIQLYNLILGGLKKEDGTIIPGLNMLLNLHRQKLGLSQREMPVMLTLHKQILSEVVGQSYRMEPYREGDEYQMLQDIMTLGESWFGSEGLVSQLLQKMDYLEQLDQQALVIHAKNNVLSQISNTMFGDWSILPQALSNYWISQNPIPSQPKQVLKWEETKEKALKNPYFTFDHIEKAFRFEIQNKLIEQATRWNQWNDKPLVQYFKNGGVRHGEESKVSIAFTEWEKLKEWMTEWQKQPINSIKSKDNKHIVKTFFDAVLDVLHFIKPLSVELDKCDGTPAFYSDFLRIYGEMDRAVPLYNKVRNFMTQKPYSYEKLKLNFNKGTLLYGWSKSKETDCLGVLLKDNETFYLGIMDYRYNKSFTKIPNIKPGEKVIQKVDCHFLANPSKNLPRCLIAPYEKRLANCRNDGNMASTIIQNYADENKLVAPSMEILDRYKNGEHIQKGFQREGFNKVVNYFKIAITEHPEWKSFQFNFKPTDQYQNVGDFYQEINEQGYKLSLVDIPYSYVSQLVEQGKLYLFQIYNKDFSPFSKGKPNLHTLYWKALFNPHNLENPIYKLNGEAEIFFRRSSIEYTEEERAKGHHYTQLKDKFNYPILKDRRFSLDKFQFNVPIALNYARKDKSIGPQALEIIQQHKHEIHYIGLDRGERHLLYLCVINNKGEIVEQRSLNSLKNGYTKDGKEVAHDYQQKLYAKEIERDKARKDWDSIESIKELKEGYMSIIVHELAHLIVKYNGLVILEDLNFGFKRGRFKVERQVYQKFERKLIEKLNHLVFKEVDQYSTGGIFQALQLTDKFKSFKQLGKQSGLIFYLPAAYTSKIDPLTGFISQVPWKYTNVKDAIKWLRNFKQVRYNAGKDQFEWEFDQRDFLPNPSGYQHEWTLLMNNEERWHWSKQAESTHGKGAHLPIRLKEAFEDLLNKHNILYNGNPELLSDMLQVTDANFYKTLFFYLRVLTQLRFNNGKSGELEDDFILSPVAKPGQQPFDTRKRDPSLPMDADANGAYHIAMKGLMFIDRLEQKGEKLRLPKLDKNEWLCFMQQRAIKS